MAHPLPAFVVELVVQEHVALRAAHWAFLAGARGAPGAAARRVRGAGHALILHLQRDAQRRVVRARRPLVDVP